MSTEFNYNYFYYDNMLRSESKVPNDLQIAGVKWWTRQTILNGKQYSYCKGSKL